MRTQLVVEENIVDLTKELDAQLTFAVDDIASFASKNTNYSKTIVIPGTAQNNFIFGHIFDINIYNTHNPASQNVGYNYNAAKSAKAEIYIDNMLLFKGVVRVLEINIIDKFVEYEVSLTGELGGLISAIENKRLEDLDFSEYDESITAANIVASWSASTGEGVYYPLADYGEVSVNKIDYDFLTFRPALYVKEYLDKLFAAAGYTYESVFLNASFFKKLIVPCNTDRFYTTPGNLLDVKVATQYVFPALDAASWAQSAIDFDDEIIDLLIYTPGDGDCISNRAEPFMADIDITVNYSYDHVAPVDMEIIVFVQHNVYTTVLQTSQFKPAGVGSGTINLTGSVNMEFGDVLKVFVERRVSADPNSGEGLFVNSFSYDVDSEWIITTSSKISVNLGDMLAINGFIPKNIYQKDFLTWIGKMFNLMYYEDRDKNKHLKIEPYINFYDTNLDNAVDWTHKQDLKSPIVIKPLGEVNSKIYEWKYKDDADYYNELYKKKFSETYGSLLFDTGYEFVKNKNTVEIGFSASPIVQYAGNDKCLSVFYKKQSTVDAKEEPTTTNPRILVRSAAPIACTSWKIKDEASVLGTYTVYGYAGHLDDPISPVLDINFGAPKQFYFTFVGGYLSANLYNVYWSAYLGEIIDKDSKLLTSKFRLTAADIQNLDFTKLIFLGGQLFRLNKVEDFNTVDEDVTRCELLNVINVV